MLPRFAFGVAHLSDMTHYTHGKPICQALFSNFFIEFLCMGFRGFSHGNPIILHFFQDFSNIFRSERINRITELTIHMEGFLVLHNVGQFLPAQADQS